MKSCFKLAALPAALTLWWAGRGMRFLAHDWRIAWPWFAALAAGAWLTWWALLYAVFPDLKLGSKRGLISRMDDDLDDSGIGDKR